MNSNNVHDLGVPSSTAGDGGGGGGNFGERLARLEEKVNHLATSNDVAGVKELIMQNNTELKTLIHDNQMNIQEQRISNLKWGIGLAVSSVLALAALVITAFSYLPDSG